MSMFYAFVAICFCGSVLAQVPSRGSCPPVKLQPNFKSEKWLGKWYEAERFYSSFELQSSCNTYVSTRDPDGNINITLSLYSNFTQCEEVFQRRVTVPDCEQPAKMLIHIPLLPDLAISNLLVLATDYDSYSVVYSCNEYGELYIQFAWIISRVQFPSKSVLTKAYKVLDENCIDRKNLFKTDNKDCKDDEEEEEEE